MSGSNSFQKPVGEIEGYQVFCNEGEAAIKQEPVDPEYEETGQSKSADSLSSQGIRNLLQQLVESGNKDLSVKSVVEKLLQQNEKLLAENDAQSLKPHTRSVKQKQTEGLIVTPSDPTDTCSYKDIPNINEALVEVKVNGANESNFDPDVVCAVGSKIMLMTNQGQPLEMDITHYWCNFCNFKSEKKDILLQHVMQHRFHCKFCKYQSFSRAAVIHHCTETHTKFNETAKILKYCTYLPDLLLKGNLKKRVPDRSGEKNPSTKRKRTEDITLEMEVEDGQPTEKTSSVTRTQVVNPPPNTRVVNPPPNTQVVNPPPNTQVVNPPTKLVNASKDLSNIDETSRYPSIIENAASGSSDFPVISNVTSGHNNIKALLANKLSSKPALEKNELSVSSETNMDTSTQIKESGVNVTVSSGLCWSCGYCDFVTVSQSYLRIHLNSKHPSRAHKYVAMLANSEKELQRIKASDANLFAETGTSNTVPQVNAKKPSPLDNGTSKASAENKKTSDSPIVEIDHAENDSPDDDVTIPRCFKCAHCNFSFPEDDQVKSHLLQRHNGCVIYALDMKAVKLKKKRYVFFCLLSDCSFKTKETERYLEHISACTPWLDGNDKGKSVDAALYKSLELTKAFIKRTATVTDFGKDFTNRVIADYACIYCTYISSNNTRLKKHVMTTHSDKPFTIKDVPGSKGNKMSLIYFCNLCLWETKNKSDVKPHELERHKTETANKETNSSSNSLTNKVARVDRDITPGPKTKTSEDACSKEVSTNTQDNWKEASPNDKAKEASVSNRVMPSAASASHGDKEEASSIKPKQIPADMKSEVGEHDDDLYSEVNAYEGVISKSKYDEAFSAYIESECLDSNKRRGVTRKAAVKCQMKVNVKVPPLYKCLYCEEVHFGTKLMRTHIKEKHENEPLRAVDILRQETKAPEYLMYFCPSQECKTFDPRATGIVNHAKVVHGIDSTDADLVLIMNPPAPRIDQASTPTRSRPSTASTGESYECLYCSTSKRYHSRKDMKKHLLEKHKSDEFIFRDCVARKLRQPSRFYMCHKLVCDFIVEKQRDYLLHMLAHEKTKIYECSKCNWFSSFKRELTNHCKTLHEGESVPQIPVDLDIDARGYIVRRVGGKVIKTEK